MSDTPSHGGNGVDHDVADDSAADVEVVADAVAEDAPKEPETSPKSAEQLRIEELEAALEAAQAKLRHYSDAVDRARSELSQTRVRLEREQVRVIDEKKTQVVEGMLGVADTLHSALQGAGDGGQAFIDGINIVAADFQKALSELGLTRFDPTGEVFDPNRHDALTMMPVADKAHDGKVVQVLHHGAMVGDKVLRAAKVVVGKHMSA